MKKVYMKGSTDNITLTVSSVFEDEDNASVLVKPKRPQLGIDL